MSRRPVPSSDRPTLERERRGPLQFLREEWSVLGLAAVLTIMTWYITRLDVEKEHPLKKIAFDLHVKASDRVALPVGVTRPIMLKCSASEHEEAKALLQAQDNVLVVDVDAPNLTGATRLTESNSTIRYPFRSSYLAPNQDEKVRGIGFVYPVQPRNVRILLPSLEGTARDQVDVEFVKKPEIELLLPPNEGDTITPDPIDLDEVLANRGDSREVIHKLRFGVWERATEESVRVFRHHLEPQLDFRVALRFRVVEQKVSNRVIYDVEGPERYTFIVTNRRDTGMNVAPPDKAELPLKAPESLMRILTDEEGKKGWTWVIRLTGELPLEGTGEKRLRGEIDFMASDPRLRDPRIEFEAPKDSKGFEIVVERPKRD